MHNQQQTIIVVTGVMAAGKSTIARLLAQQFARGVHIEADVLQHMIVSGGQWAGDSEAGEPEDETARQLRLRLKNMCQLGISFFEAGFTVVLDDIILGERWQHLQHDLDGYPFLLVVLAPHVDIVEQRDQNRPQSTRGRAWAAYLDHELRQTMSGKGLWIDTSTQTPEQTVDDILTWIASGKTQVF